MIVECRGTAQEMGRAQGAACREVLARLRDIAFDLIPSELARKPAARTVLRSVHAVAATYARRSIGRDLATHYPLQRERLAGIAEGAGISERALFIGPFVEAVLDSTSYVMPGACTAIGLTGARTASGAPLIAKNFDYPAVAADVNMVRVSRPTDGRAASIELTAAPLPGSHEGVNEHGLAVAYNYGHFQGRASARVTITNLVQELLEECRTVAEAIERVQRRPRTGSAILMLADAAGDVASVEVSPDDIAIRRGEALVHANHAVTPAMSARDIPHEACYSRWNPVEIRGRRVHESSEARHARAEAIVADADVVSVSDLRAALSDHDGGPGDLSLCRHGPYYATTAAVILDPKRRSVDVVLGSPCEGGWTTIQL